MNKTMSSATFDDAPKGRRPNATPQRRHLDQSYLADLIAVLRIYPGGLRRWSVMRAMRALAEKADREVTRKFEDDVERVFRHHCAGDAVRAGMPTDPASELFHRPKDKTGDVWALNAGRAEAWLGARTT